MRNELKLGIRFNFLPGGLIRTRILIADISTGKTHGGISAPMRYLTFEMMTFGTNVIANQMISFGDIAHFNESHANAKTSDLAVFLLHSIVFNFCRKVIFNVTSREVCCSVMLDNHQILRSINDYRWKTEGEMLGHFFSRD